MAINVKDPQFGAKGDGSVDDYAAIQSAIDYAKNLNSNPSLPSRTTVYFPAGYYFIGTSINLTNASGIWLVGDGGSYFNTILLGNTGNKAIFDFSGSSSSGCENFSFLLPTGNPAAANLSTLGVQFALTNNGGLNCGIRNCYFLLNDSSSANGGLGSIGVLNIRSEEFYVHDCLIRANTPIVLSYSSNLATAGVNYTASSAYQALAAGTGSMGVVHINGTSLQCIEKRQPALILAGTNSVNFQGYLSRLTGNSGTNETAILCTTSTSNLKVHATVESLSRLLKVGENSNIENTDLDVVMANVTAPSTEVIDITICGVIGLRARISLPVPSERNRTVLYHAPAAGGTTPAAGYLINSEITCYAITNNQFIISANLLRRSTNVLFNTAVPFEKRNGRIRLLTNRTPVIGVIGSLSALTVLQFTEARVATATNNSGFYRVWLDGVIRAGGYGSGKAATLCFQAQLVINQSYTGIYDPPAISVIILDQSTSDPTYLNIIGVLLNITFNAGIGTVTLTTRITGSGTGEPVYYEGYAELQSDFFISDPIPIG